MTQRGKQMPKWFEGVLLWREKHIREKTFVMVLALLVGIFGGFAALVLKGLIHFISTLLTGQMEIYNGNVWLFILPLAGVTLCFLYVRYFVRENISHGVTRVLYAISQKKSRLKRKNMYTSVVASSITIGFGGSVGAEGPIVYTGAAIGSNLGSLFRLSPQVLMILVGCGAAAGIAGIFKAPIAGMLFTLEVLMIDLTTVTVMPLLIASISAATVAYVFTGYNFEFFFMQSEPFHTAHIPFVIILGLFCAGVSLYFTKVMTFMEGSFKRVNNPWLKLALGGLLLSGLVFLFPPLYGEGYDGIIELLGGDPSKIVNTSIFYADRNSVTTILMFTAAVMLLKAFATSATNGAGGVGGTFAPSLFVGCIAGFFLTYLLNNLFGLDLSEKNFALMGMAGVMAGVMHAPLMGIFLTAELTGGYELFLPLLIVACMSYGVTKQISPYSIYTQRLAQRGELLTHHKDKAVLTLLKIDNVIERDCIPVRPEMTLGDVVGVISRSSRNLFPVVDTGGNLLGIVLLDDIRNIMFRTDLYKHMRVSKFMSMPPARVILGQPMDRVMKIFDDTGAWNLPVVDEAGVYQGFVSKSKIFNSYRHVLRHYSDD